MVYDLMFICMSAQIVSLDLISDPGVKKSVVIPKMKKTKRARHCLFDERRIIDACLFVIDGSIRVCCNDFVTHRYTSTHTHRHKRTQAHTQAHTRPHTYTMHTHPHTSTYTCTCTCICAYTCTRTYTCTAHTHTQTHIFTRNLDTGPGQLLY